MIEDGVKTGKILDPYARSEDTSALHSQKPPGRKSKEPEISVILPGPKPSNPISFQTGYSGQPQQQPQSYYPQQNPLNLYQGQNSQSLAPQGPSPQNVSHYQWRNRNFTSLGIPVAEAYQFLLSSGHLNPIPARKLSNPLPPKFREDLQCAYHSGQLGHETERCTTQKHKIQDLIDSGTIKVEDTEPLPGTTTSPLPNR